MRQLQNSILSPLRGAKGLCPKHRILAALRLEQCPGAGGLNQNFRFTGEVVDAHPHPNPPPQGGGNNLQQGRVFRFFV